MLDSHYKMLRLDDIEFSRYIFAHDIDEKYNKYIQNINIKHASPLAHSDKANVEQRC